MKPRQSCSGIYFLSKHKNIHFAANIVVFVRSTLKKKNPTAQPLNAFSARLRRGIGSQYVSVYGCPAELHRAVRPYSCSNGPLRSSSLWAEKAGRPSGRPVVEGERAQSWTRRAFKLMTGAIKEHRSGCSLPQPPPPQFPHLKTEKRGLIVCCESQRLESLPSLFLPCLSLLLRAPSSSSEECDPVQEIQREFTKNFGIFPEDL